MMLKTKIVVAFFLFLVFSIPLLALAGPVPDTGQTICYDNSGVTDCPSTGEPFYGQDASYTINPPSYTKLDENGDALPDDATTWVMVRDNVTGLIWEVKADDESIHDKDNTYTWYDSNTETNGGDAGTPGDGTDTEDFIQALNDASFGGYSDWRLPNREELHSIIDYGRHSPSIDIKYFPYTLSNHYWSSTTLVGDNYMAWRVNFLSGYDGYDLDYGKSNSYYIRAVRGGQSSSKLVDNGDGTVTDVSTGLMWQQTHGEAMTWEVALAYCEDLSHAGYSDWRLPNIKELSSIVDLNTDGPAIDKTYFPNTVSSGYWSSTTDVSYIYGAWYVHFLSGIVFDMNGSDYVRAVRGGQNRLLDYLVIHTPSQGGGLTPGSVMKITWDTKDIPGNVKISISRQGGKDGTFSETIAESTENDGSYNWAVTGPDSFNCMLKMEPLEAGYESKGTIQGLFTIDNPTMSVDQPSHNYGSAIVGSSCPVKTFTITNTGLGGLQINNVSITGQDTSDFLITSNGCTGQALQPSDLCTIDVEFCPTSTGEKNAKLSISSNDPTEPLIELSLAGLGLNPADLMVTLADEFEAIGALGGPFTPTSSTYTLENTGDVPLNWTASKSAVWMDLSATSGSLESGATTQVTVSINNVAENYALGTYTDTVSIVNTTNGNGDTSRDVILRVVLLPGEEINSKAVLVAGGGPYPGNHLWSATKACCDYTYYVLSLRGYSEDKIRYLSHESPVDNDKVYGPATNTALDQAIQWAADVEELLLYLNDHGGNGTFKIGQYETLTATQLDSWLDTLQDQYDVRVIMIYDACYSGSFLPVLKATGEQDRVLISSAGDDERAYFVSDGVVSFSWYFWSLIDSGETILGAFSNAKNSIQYSFIEQTPYLETNGNGIGNEKEDGTLVSDSYIGTYVVAAAEPPVIATVSPSQHLSGKSSADIYAEGVTCDSVIVRVWGVVVPPDFEPGSPDNPVTELPTFELTHVGSGRYEGTYTNFKISGEYTITLYAEDVNNLISDPVQTTVVKKGSMPWLMLLLSD
jgi:uncharacterized protein DUF1566/peptidase C13-like protein/HYDIN/CFA65/VesB family protein/Ser-Thr-rich glycosyl-phosphatidyl-inositol-anchored membrane family protein